MITGATRSPVSSATRSGIRVTGDAQRRVPALGLDWVYVVFPVSPTGRRGALGRHDAGSRRAERSPCRTRPTPRPATSCTRSSGLGAVNTVVPRDGALVGDSTDGEGFVRSSTTRASTARAPRACCSARAVARGRSRWRSRRGAAGHGRGPPSRGGRSGSLPCAGRRHCRPRRDSTIEGFDVVVNATPLGMEGEAPPFDTAELHTGQFVYDTVYPVETPLLAGPCAAAAPSTGSGCSSTRGRCRSRSGRASRPARRDAGRRLGQTR